MVDRSSKVPRQAHAEPLMVILEILRRASGPLPVAEIRRELQANGFDEAQAQRLWRNCQPRIKAHQNVTMDAGRYAWHEQPARLTPSDALDLIARGQLSPERKAALLAIVGEGLAAASDAGRQLSQSRRNEVTAMRALAELAIEVEELATNEASARAMIHRVRARTKLAKLEPIDRAGERATFDRQRHDPIGAPIEDATAVVVVRPGYVWDAPDERILLARPIVRADPDAVPAPTSRMA